VTVNRRAVLEAIVHARDPRVTPGDRLRAIEMLQELGDEDVAAETVYRHDLASLDGPDLDAFVDSLLVHEYLVAGLRRFPELAGVLEREVERKSCPDLRPRQDRT
jgi:hypothetical protein